jgi:hypothetical protein
MLEKEIPFEIHITIDNLTFNRQQDFIEYCLTKDAKPLIIELSKGDFIHQPMFSKVIYSNNFDFVLALSSELSNEMKALNFFIKRLKIEVPSQNWILFQDFFTNFKKYYEWHCKVDFFRIDELLELCDKHKVHLSLNSLKNEINSRFITLREFGTIQQFESRIFDISKDLEKQNIQTKKQQSEYCIYDNNSFLDSGWLPQ